MLKLVEIEHLQGSVNPMFLTLLTRWNYAVLLIITESIKDEFPPPKKSLQYSLELCTCAKTTYNKNKVLRNSTEIIFQSHLIFSEDKLSANIGICSKSYDN